MEDRLVDGFINSAILTGRKRRGEGGALATQKLCKHFFFLAS